MVKKKSILLFINTFHLETAPFAKYPYSYFKSAETKGGKSMLFKFPLPSHIALSGKGCMDLNRAGLDLQKMQEPRASVL